MKVPLTSTAAVTSELEPFAFMQQLSDDPWGAIASVVSIRGPSWARAKRALTDHGSHFAAPSLFACRQFSPIRFWRSGIFFGALGLKCKRSRPDVNRYTHQLARQVCALSSPRRRRKGRLIRTEPASDALFGHPVVWQLATYRQRNGHRPPAPHSGQPMRGDAIVVRHGVRGGGARRGMD